MIFVDTGVFYARLDEDDENHRQAEAFFRGAALTAPLVTRTAVVYETHALLLRMSRIPPSAGLVPPALGFLREIEAGLVAKVVHVSEADHQAARALVERHADKSYSFCDAISFVIMERFKITRAAATSGSTASSRSCREGQRAVGIPVDTSKWRTAAGAIRIRFRMRTCASCPVAHSM